MFEDEENRIADKTDKLLEELMRDVLSESYERHTSKIRKRRWFGVALLVVAVFCICVSQFLWPIGDTFHRTLWVIFSLTLLFAGGWQIDKAAGEESRTVMNDLRKDGPAELKQSGSIHRIR